ncbi:hypothetical protein [Vibrio parahaemolyticus]
MQTFFATKLRTHVKGANLGFDTSADHSLYDRLEINLLFSMKENSSNEMTSESSYHLIEIIEDVVNIYDATEQQKKDAIVECLRTAAQNPIPFRRKPLFA